MQEKSRADLNKHMDWRGCWCHLKFKKILTHDTGVLFSRSCHGDSLALLSNISSNALDLISFDFTWVTSAHNDHLFLKSHTTILVVELKVVISDMKNMTPAWHIQNAEQRCCEATHHRCLSEWLHSIPLMQDLLGSFYLLHDSARSRDQLWTYKIREVCQVVDAICL